MTAPNNGVSLDAVYALQVDLAGKLGRVADGVDRVEVRLERLEDLYNRVDTRTALVELACDRHSEAYNKITSQLDIEEDVSMIHRAQIATAWSALRVAGAIVIGASAIAGAIFALIK